MKTLAQCAIANGAFGCMICLSILMQKGLVIMAMAKVGSVSATSYHPQKQQKGPIVTKRGTT